MIHNSCLVSNSQAPPPDHCTAATRYGGPLLSRFGTQPQRDVGGLHRLSNHPYEVVAQGVQVCFVTQLGREGLQGFSCVVLPSVEATVYERLDASPQGVEQPSYHKGGYDNGELRLLL